LSWDVMQHPEHYHRQWLIGLRKAEAIEMTKGSIEWMTKQVASGNRAICMELNLSGIEQEHKRQLIGMIQSTVAERHDCACRTTITDQRDSIWAKGFTDDAGVEGQVMRSLALLLSLLV
jgi:hypothetical protein